MKSARIVMSGAVSAAGSAAMSTVLLVCALMLCSTACNALIMPHGISGYVLELDGITQVRQSVYFSINNTNNGFFLVGKTGRGADTGKYVATVNGENGDAIIVKAWNDYDETSRQITLEGVMFNVNLLLNTTVAVHPPIITSSPIFDAYEDYNYTYQVQAFDEDYDDLFYSVRIGPKKLSVNSTSALVNWLPTKGDIGQHLVVIEVTDSVFVVNQSFVLTVHHTNHNPRITTSPVLNAVEDSAYRYDVNASDRDNDTLTYLLIGAPAGMSMNSSTGLITWTPLQTDLGMHSVAILVDDNNGGRAYQSYNLTVANVNDAPVITSSPIISAVEEMQYKYSVEAYDEDNNQLFYSLVVHPQGMAISSNGTISWIPNHEQVGPNEVKIVVSDANLSAFQNFTVVVEKVNHLPIITSQPITAALEDQIYQYQVNATDIDNEILRYSLVLSPQNMTIDPANGLVRWVPHKNDIGMHNVTVGVSDKNGTTTQFYVLAVRHRNHAPQIVSAPVLTATQDMTYSYHVLAMDTDNDSLRYRLNVSPYGMSIDVTSGLILWTPNASQRGNFSVKVVVSDGNMSDSQSFVVFVQRVNHPPVITTTPAVNATIGVIYVYDVNATDPDNDKLTYSLRQAPGGMTIDSNSGYITWLPKEKDAAKHIVTVAVNDSQLTATQTYTLTVVEQNHCRISCFSQIKQCLQSAKQDYKICQHDALSSYQSCVNKCFVKKNACELACRQKYFSALKNCGDNFKTENSLCWQNGDSCVDQCDGKKSSQTTKVKTNLNANTKTVVSVDLEIVATATHKNPVVQINQLSQRPVATISLPVGVYQYLSIEQLNLDDAIVKGANITFYVEKSWLRANGFTASDIVLRRFHNNLWQTLPTKVLYSDDTKVYYSAETSGFSYFAISATKGHQVVQEYRIHKTIKTPVSISGVLLRDDRRTQFPSGTKLTFTNTRTNQTFEAQTGAGPYPGGFFVIVDADTGDKLVLAIAGIRSNLSIEGDIDFARFVVDNASRTILVEKSEPNPNQNQAKVPASSNIATGWTAAKDLFFGAKSAGIKASSLIEPVIIAICAVTFAFYLFARVRKK